MNQVQVNARLYELVVALSLRRSNRQRLYDATGLPMQMTPHVYATCVVARTPDCKRSMLIERLEREVARV